MEVVSFVPAGKLKLTALALTVATYYTLLRDEYYYRWARGSKFADVGEVLSGRQIRRNFHNSKKIKCTRHTMRIG